MTDVTNFTKGIKGNVLESAKNLKTKFPTKPKKGEIMNNTKGVISNVGGYKPVNNPLYIQNNSK